MTTASDRSVEIIQALSEFFAVLDDVTDTLYETWVVNEKLQKAEERLLRSLFTINDMKKYRINALLRQRQSARDELLPRNYEDATFDNSFERFRDFARAEEIYQRMANETFASAFAARYGKQPTNDTDVIELANQLFAVNEFNNADEEVDEGLRVSVDTPTMQAPQAQPRPVMATATRMSSTGALTLSHQLDFTSKSQAIGELAFLAYGLIGSAIDMYREYHRGAVAVSQSDMQAQTEWLRNVVEFTRIGESLEVRRIQNQLETNGPLLIKDGRGTIADQRLTVPFVSQNVSLTARQERLLGLVVNRPYESSVSLSDFMSPSMSALDIQFPTPSIFGATVGSILNLPIGIDARDGALYNEIQSVLRVVSDLPESASDYDRLRSLRVGVELMLQAREGNVDDNPVQFYRTSLESFNPLITRRRPIGPLEQSLTESIDRTTDWVSRATSDMAQLRKYIAISNADQLVEWALLIDRRFVKSLRFRFSDVWLDYVHDTPELAGLTLDRLRKETDPDMVTVMRQRFADVYDQYSIGSRAQHIGQHAVFELGKKTKRFVARASQNAQLMSQGLREATGDLINITRVSAWNLLDSLQNAVTQMMFVISSGPTSIVLRSEISAKSLDPTRPDGNIVVSIRFNSSQENAIKELVPNPEIKNKTVLVGDISVNIVILEWKPITNVDLRKKIIEMINDTDRVLEELDPSGSLVADSPYTQPIEVPIAGINTKTFDPVREAARRMRAAKISDSDLTKMSEQANLIVSRTKKSLFGPDPSEHQKTVPAFMDFWLQDSLDVESYRKLLINDLETLFAKIESSIDDSSKPKRTLLGSIKFLIGTALSGLISTLAAMLSEFRFAVSILNLLISTGAVAKISAVITSFQRMTSTLRNKAAQTFAAALANAVMTGLTSNNQLSQQDLDELRVKYSDDMQLLEFLLESESFSKSPPWSKNIIVAAVKSWNAIGYVFNATSSLLSAIGQIVPRRIRDSPNASPIGIVYNSINATFFVSTLLALPDALACGYFLHVSLATQMFARWISKESIRAYREAIQIPSDLSGFSSQQFSKTLLYLALQSSDVLWSIGSAAFLRIESDPLERQYMRTAENLGMHFVWLLNMHYGTLSPVWTVSTAYPVASIASNGLSALTAFIARSVIEGENADAYEPTVITEARRQMRPNARQDDRTTQQVGEQDREASRIRIAAEISGEIAPSVAASLPENADPRLVDVLTGQSTPSTPDFALSATSTLASDASGLSSSDDVGNDGYPKIMAGVTVVSKEEEDELRADGFII